MRSEVKRLLDQANNIRKQRLLSEEDVMGLIARVSERGGYEFIHGGEANSTSHTTAAIAAKVNGRVYFGVAAAYANCPSPKRISRWLGGLNGEIRPETRERKLLAWIGSGEALCVDVDAN